MSDQFTDDSDAETSSKYEYQPISDFRGLSYWIWKDRVYDWTTPPDNEIFENLLSIYEGMENDSRYDEHRLLTRKETEEYDHLVVLWHRRILKNGSIDYSKYVNCIKLTRHKPTGQITSHRVWFSDTLPVVANSLRELDDNAYDEWFRKHGPHGRIIKELFEFAQISGYLEEKQEE